MHVISRDITGPDRRLLFEDTLDFLGRSLPLFGSRVVDAPEDLPLARGAVTASDELIRHADQNTPRERFQGWIRWRDMYPLSYFDKEHIEMPGKWQLEVLWEKEVWLIQRFCFAKTLPLYPPQFLTFHLGPLLLCANSSTAAKRLAVYSHITPIERAGGMAWTNLSDLSPTP
jgi:hypothetical protein